MSKKNIIITITIILVVALLSLMAYYFLINQNENNIGITSTFKKFFPFGGDTITTTSTTTDIFPTTDEKPQTPNYTQKLRKLWSEPVAGAGIMDTKAGSVVRFIERATGHIYEIELFSPNQNRLSNVTIPLIYNALWPNKLNAVITEQLAEDNQTVNSYILTLKTGTTTENNISGNILADKIENISIFNDVVFYMQKLNTGSIGFVSTVGSSKSKQVWNSPIKEWNSQFVNKTTVALTTKPHENYFGFLYFINTTNNQSRKILGNIYGLSTLVNDTAEKIIYLSQENDLAFYLYNIKTQNKSLISPTTFPEKCVWSKKNVDIVYCAVPESSLNRSSLTNWYMGRISFIDDIWQYDLKTNTTTIISYLSDEGGEDIDVIKPILSENEQYLIFINKKDNSLWSLDLTK